MTDDLTDDEVLALLRAGIPDVQEDIERAAWLRPQCTSDTGVRIILRRLALARRELAAMRHERDAYATRAAEWLAEKHLADEDHASDVEIVVARERESCAALVESEAQHLVGAEAFTLRALAIRIRARGDAGRGET